MQRLLEAVGSSRRLGRLIGGLVGLFAGAYLGAFVCIGVFTAEARFGIFLFSVDYAVSIRWEVLPFFAGITVGVVAGITDAGLLGRTLRRGLAGALAGAAIGWPAGSWLWGGATGPWAGAVIGSAAGLLAGAVWGLARGGRRRERDLGHQA